MNFLSRNPKYRRYCKNGDIFICSPLQVRLRPYLIMAPAMIITIGIMYPFIMAIYYSLTNFRFGSRTYGLSGFKTGSVC